MPVFSELKYTAAKSALSLKASISTTIRSRLTRIAEELADEWLMQVQSVVE
jgi:hypothetical protein